MNKEYFLVIDTETAESVNQPMPYDISYGVCDRQGTVIEKKGFLVEEIFCNNKESMKSSYFAEKIPQYWEMVKNGERTIQPLYKIRREILADMKKYNIKKVGAYNMGFDKRALNNDVRYCTKSFLRWFFPYGTEFFCIWNMACQLILSQKTYIKFALKNNFVSDKGNILTNAECCYRYITKNTEFIEKHMALEDVEIEIEILAHCYRQHKKVDTSIYSACWRLPQRVKKEMDLKSAFKSM